VDEKLQETSSLLVELQSKQEERLSQPPSISPTSGHLILKPPSQDEMGVAKEIQQTLASLTAMVNSATFVRMLDLHSSHCLCRALSLLFLYSSLSGHSRRCGVCGCPPQCYGSVCQFRTC